jgi:uncharacterized protein (TIGR00730 family)
MVKKRIVKSKKGSGKKKVLVSKVKSVKVKRSSKIDPKHFRVAIFGSARLSKGDVRYKQVFSLAKMIALCGMDIVTGGGPGLMDAASRGHHAGRKEKKASKKNCESSSSSSSSSSKSAHSIGLTINLPMEQNDGYHLDIKKDFNRFSNRLDSFMELSNAVVVAPGGIGTLLELLYTWQLVQVKHICETPIILLGAHWQGLLDWIKKEMARKKLMSMSDFNNVFVVRTASCAMRIIKKVQMDSMKSGHVCSNFKKYKKKR